MKTLLHIGPHGAQCWQKSQAGWQLQTDAPTGPVWALTDLTEEGLAQIQIPRLLGRDRRDYTRRQLAHRFPDTLFRIALAQRGSGSFMQRLAAPSQLLLAVDANECLQAALVSQAATLAGLWSTSMLLALIGRHPNLPPDLFIVKPGRGGLRVVFLQDRCPVLTRLAPATDQATEQAAEIARTLHHLENTREIARSKRRHAVLFLGESAGLAAALAAQGLDRVTPPPPWHNGYPRDWQFALFDLALKSPIGQLAPLEQRAAFLGQRLRRSAYAASALVLGMAGFAGNGQFQASVATQHERDQIQTQVQQVQVELAQAKQGAGRWSVTPQRLRLALSLDQQEVTMAPDIAAAMSSVAEIVEHHAPARVRRLDWQLLSGADVACVARGSNSAPATTTESANALPHPVELRLELALDATATAQARTRTLAEMTRELSQLSGATLLLDPARERFENTLSSDSQAPTANWCLTLANPLDPQPKPTVQPS